MFVSPFGSSRSVVGQNQFKHSVSAQAADTGRQTEGLDSTFPGMRKCESDESRHKAIILSRSSSSPCTRSTRHDRGFARPVSIEACTPCSVWERVSSHLRA